MSVQDSSLSVSSSTSSYSAEHAAVAGQQGGSRWHWFVADDLRLALRAVSGNEEYEAADAVADTTPEMVEQIGLFHDAIALAEHEPLLTCIDHWCAAALDWKPLPRGEKVPQNPDSDIQTPTDADVDVTIIALDRPERAIELALSVERLKSMPAFPPELADIAALSWRQISVVLCIDRFELSKDDIKRLGPGALTVLPASFREAWHGSINVAHNDESTGVRIDAATGELLRLFDAKQVDDRQSVSVSTETLASQPPTLNIMLADLIDIDVRQWRTASQALPSLTACGPLCGKRVLLELTTGSSEADKFTGEIVSLGAGYAVRILTTTDCA